MIIIIPFEFFAAERSDLVGRALRERLVAPVRVIL